MTDVVGLILSFCLYLPVQALCINGIRELFTGGCIDDMNKGRRCSGNLFYSIAPKFLEKNKHKTWSKPLFSCVKCMSSVYGTIMYWIPVIWFFGFSWIEIFGWFVNMFCLVILNWIVYNKL